MILIRDDGSTDATNEIIDCMIEKFPDKIARLPSDANVGVIRSFELLIQACGTDYAFFCDQDDYWLPTKIERSKKAMKAMEMKYDDMPIGIYTDLKVVDENLQEIHPSFWDYSKIEPKLLRNFHQLCVHPAATGCTMMINKRAIQSSLPFSENTRMHDAWIVLKILQNGGFIKYIEEPQVLYRQHCNNVVGAINESENYLKIRFKNLKGVISNNREQWAMIDELGFHSRLRYLYEKIVYQIRYACLKYTKK